MTESIETRPLTVQDIIDDPDFSVDGVKYHSILEVWRAVIRPAHAEVSKKITPQWANRICSTHREINFADMEHFKDVYFDKIFRLEMILDEEIASDDECLNVLSPEEDVEHNSEHYRNLLTNWQLEFLRWELEWDCLSETAAIEVAAFSEIHRMMFDSTGLTSLLDNIQFQITEEQQQRLADALQARKDAYEKEG